MLVPNGRRDLPDLVIAAQGYVVGMLMTRRKTMADLLPTPYAQLHLRWMLQAAQNSEYSNMVGWGSH